MIDISENHLRTLYNDCGRHYNKLSVLLMEEMSELQKELCKVFRETNFACIHPTEGETYFPNGGLEAFYYALNPSSRLNIAEEMAHVYICMESIRKLMNITDDDIQFFIDAKEDGGM